MLAERQLSYYDCGGHLSGFSGEFSSPNYPSYYPSNARCIWEIQVEYNSYVYVQFDHIALEPNSNCNHDFIEIYERQPNASTLLGRICTGSYEIFTSNSNRMTVVFSSDGSYQNTGFHASYYTVFIDYYHCGGYLSGSSGTFSSPNYPSYYPSNARCIWEIQVQYNGYVHVQFDHVSYTSTLLGRICTGGYQAFTSYSNRMMVVFLSDGSYQNTGFHASYYTFFRGKNNYFSSSGTFQSPFYPGNYPNNADCVWEIEAVSNYRFTKCLCLFPRTEGGTCQYDYIEIYDGPLYTSPLLGKICYGSYLTYTSSSNLMTVRFHSDSSITKRGFRAAYYTIPADQNTSKFMFNTELRFSADNLHTK
uniref:CUB domain-containing protein n=1 Tax=Chrysemys picta bellii TaxID=8478 RepID=A0A8C3F269_CHRPI